MTGLAELDDHSTIAVRRRPTPRGGLVDFLCEGCTFVSAPVPIREVGMWAWMHASGVAGLPGTRIGTVEVSWMDRDEQDYFSPSVSEEDEAWWKEVMES